MMNETINSKETAVTVSPPQLITTGAATGSEVKLFKNQMKPRQINVSKMLLPMMFAIAMSTKPVSQIRNIYEWEVQISVTVAKI